MKILTLVFCLLLFCAAQLRAQSATAAPDPTGKAVVYFYSLATGATLGTVKKPVFLDDNEIVEIRPAKFFIVLLDPGVHNFPLRNKKFGGIEMDFKAGETYYLRMNWESDGKLAPAGISKIEPESGAFDVKNLKPVAEKNIKNREIVLLKLKP